MYSHIYIYIYPCLFIAFLLSGAAPPSPLASLVCLIMYRLPDNCIYVMIGPLLLHIGYDGFETSTAGKLFGAAPRRFRSRASCSPICSVRLRSATRVVPAVQHARTRARTQWLGSLVGRVTDLRCRTFDRANINEL